MRYALVAPVLLAVTALAAPVPDGDAAGAAKRSEDLNIDGLSVSHLDVPPNVNIKNIPRSEDVSVNDVVPVDIGVPTILRRGDGDGELSTVTELLDDLGLGDVLKRDDSLITDDDFLGVDVNSLLKRDDSLLGDGDEGGDDVGDLLGILGNLKRDGPLLGDGDDDGDVLGDVLGLLGNIKRDDSLLGDGDEGGDDVGDLLGILGNLKRDDSLLGGGDHDGHGGILDVNLDIKRDDSLLGDGDDDGDLLDNLLGDVSGLLDNLKRDDSLLGGDDVIDLLKRKKETSIGGVGDVDVGTPIIDLENV
jgi:hypothetical protein